MAEAAGSSAAVASSSTAEEVTEAQLAEADRKFEAGVQSLKDNNLDEAVQHFGEVLQTRVAKYGDMDLRCADAYHRYGSALFYKAQDEADVFGASVQQAVREKDAAAGTEEQEGDDEEAEEEGVPDSEKENVDEKGKGPARVEVESADDAPEEADAEGSDMQLAWEMLEVAKLIYTAQGEEYRKQLADVHMLLADIATEQEGFDTALADYEVALTLMAASLPTDDRRLGEAHYKKALALQFLDEPERALQSAKAAIKVCEDRITNLKAEEAGQPETCAQAAAPGATASAQPAAAPEATAAPSSAATVPVDGPVTDAIAPPADPSAQPQSANGPSTEGGSGKGGKPRFQLHLAAPLAAQSGAAQEIADLEDVLEDLLEKVEELNDVIKQKRALSKDIKAAFSQVVGLNAPVQNLGVVGRGSKRINLAALPPDTGAAAPAAAPAAPGQAAPAPCTGKRSLDDLMGGSGGGTTSFGFGGAAAPSAGSPASNNATGFGSTAPAHGGALSGSASSSGAQFVLPKRAKVETLAERPGNGASNQALLAAAPAKPTLPAFLQPQSLAAVYTKPNSDSAPQ